MNLTQAVKKILITNPFYGFVMMSLNRYYDDSCDTACVRVSGINYELVVNKKYWDSISEDNQLATLMHELLHICFFHLIMMDDFPNAYKRNIAADLEVNSYIDKLKEGDDFLRVEQYGFPPRKGIKWYYENLNNTPNKQEGLEQKEKSNSSKHNSWKVLEGIDDSQKTLIRNQFDYVLKNAAEQTIKSQGSLPGELEVYIKNLLNPKPPVFNWKKYLRRLLGTAETYYLKPTRKRPSKRFPNAMGLKHKHFQNLLVAIDTSGSVKKKELAEFFVEINNISRAGADIDVLECDTQVARVYPFRRWDGNAKGRGGTDFTPIFDYYNTKHNKEYSALIIFTDGRACTNDLKASKPIIWVITSDGEVKNYPGKVCYIPKQENNG